MMSGFRNASFLVFAIFVIPTFSWCETIYVSFTTKESSVSLSKENLSLKIDEKAITLSEFFRVDTSNRTPELLSHPAGRRQYFIVLDLLHLSASQALEVRKLVQDFVTRVPKEDMIALAAITNKDGLRFFSGLTADRSKLIAGWNGMGKIILSGMMEGPEGNLYSSNFSSGKLPAQLLPDQEFVTNLKTYAVSEKAKEGFAPLYVQAFVDLASLFSTVPGRKHLILFSSGTDVKGLRVNLEELSKKKSKSDEKEEETQADEGATLREMTQQGGRAREVISSEVQARANQALQTKRRDHSDVNVVSKLIEGTGGHVHIFTPAQPENNFLRDLGQTTGGSYRKLQEFASAGAQILSSDQEFYVIGWDTDLQKSFHELHSMELSAGNAVIEAPLRWLTPKPVSDYTVIERKIYLSQALYKNFVSSEQYLFWSDIILDEGFNRISCFTQVQGKSLLQYKASKVEFVFYGFALEEDGTLIDFSSTPISLDLTNQNLIKRLEKAGLKIWNVLFAADRPVTVRTIVWNNLTGEAVTHSARMDFDQSRIFLTNPFFPSSNFDWIFWPAPDQAQNRRGKEILYPYQIGSNIFTPELFPRLQPTEKGKVIYFKMYNVGAGGKYPPVHLRLVSENGNSTEIERFGLMQQPRLIQRGGLELFWTIESIPGLAKGTYRFQVDVTDPARGKSVTREVLTTVE